MAALARASSIWVRCAGDRVGGAGLLQAPGDLGADQGRVGEQAGDMVPDDLVEVVRRGPACCRRPGRPRTGSHRGQPLGHLVHGGLRLQVPVEQLRDQHRLAGLHPDRGRITGPLGVQPVPERRAGPRQQRARPQLGLPSAAHPLSDQRPLVLRDRSADLQQQLVVRVGAHRPVQELHLAAVTGQLVDQQHLVDIVAGQPVRRGDQDQVQLGQRRMVSQPVQAPAGSGWRRYSRHRGRRAAPPAPSRARQPPRAAGQAAARWSAPGPGGWSTPAHTPPLASGTSSPISAGPGTSAQRTSSW